MAKRVLTVESMEQVRQLFGELDRNMEIVSTELNVGIKLDEGGILLRGEELLLDLAERTIEKMKERLADGPLDEIAARQIIMMVKEGHEEDIRKILNDVVTVTVRGKAIKPKTLGQKAYVDLIRSRDIVFGVGPAGTGKTYLAMAMAISAFKKNEVERIILTRPAVEAGESLGFLPGDLQEKIDPYLRPLYDALFDILGFDAYDRLKEKGLIEVAPLAYMRGRTLDNAYVILDEAQNTSNEQMKMFLTRLGYGSKAIITGDITQIDLPRGKRSGLIHAKHVLKGVDGIGFAEFTTKDVVRHPLVQKIIDAYAKADEAAEAKAAREEKTKEEENAALRGHSK